MIFYDSSWELQPIEISFFPKSEPSGANTNTRWLLTEIWLPAYTNTAVESRFISDISD
jgi:hypothetical protein